MNNEVITVQSVDRALRILEILKDERDGLGVTELSTHLEVSKSTVHRLLMSLLKKNFVKKDKNSGKYILGLKLIELGQIVSENIDIRKLAYPYLVQLVEILDETVHLASRDNNKIVYIDKIESSSSIQMYSKIGKRVPLHCTGIGKAILAFLPEEEVLHALEQIQLTRYTDNTIVKKEELLKHLKSIEKKGYSIDNEEHEKGIRCVAAPIFNYNKEVIAGISVTSLSVKLKGEKLVESTNEVVRIANEISKEYGYPG